MAPLLTSLGDLLGVVRQGEAVLTVRRRADRVRWRAIAVGGFAVAVAAAFAAAPGLGVTLGIVLLPVPIAALVKGRAPSTRIDLEARCITAVGQPTLGFEEVAAVRLSTALHVHRARYGIRWARQLWALEVLPRGAGQAPPVAEHTDEYALIAAARRVAAALDVPLLDACGQEGETVVFAPPAARPAGAVGPGAEEGEAVEVRCQQPGCGLARGLVLAGAIGLAVSLALAGREGAERFRWAFALAAATSAWGLVAAARAAAERCVEAIEVGREALVLRSRLPFMRRRTIPRGAVEAIRLSQVLLAVVPRPTEPGPRRGVLHVDLVGRGRLLRLALEHDEALRVRAALQDALARRTRPPSPGRAPSPGRRGDGATAADG